MMKIVKHDESYSSLCGEFSELLKIYNYLKVQRHGAYYEKLVQRGLESPFTYFSKLNRSNNTLLILNGHISILKNFGIEQPAILSDFTETQIDEYLKTVNLKFQPYDYQLKCVKDCILGVRKLCRLATGSGKSLSISLIADFYKKHNLKGLILVPNINLLTQFRNDIKSYNLNELYESTEILGDGVQELKECNLLISTWQSMCKHKHAINDFDYIICDEVHRFASEETSDIIRRAVSIKIRHGFTGTMPEDDCAKMLLIGLFTFPQVYITAKELIERKLATPVTINSIFLFYPTDFRVLLKNTAEYNSKLTLIKENVKRQEFITELVSKLKGNSLVLAQHVQHLKDIYLRLMKKFYNIDIIENKFITGKHSFEFQRQFGIYYLSGSDDSKTRELTRKILEHKLYQTNKGLKFDNEITDEEIISEKPQILVSNYAILSTGVNIHRLHNMIFASPLRSYNSISQAIGRGMRLSDDKNMFKVYDIVDCTGLRVQKSGVFYRSYEHRLKTSYLREQYEIKQFCYQL